MTLDRADTGPRLAAGQGAGREPLASRGVADLLIRLGPVFVKIGQYLALRPDILPQDVCDELLRLSDAVPPVPFDSMLEVLREEFGTDAESRFSWINPLPVGSASLAQAYRATLPNGTDVAIKVQRPNLKPRVERDLGRLGRLARLLDRVAVQPIDAKELVAELRRWLANELDFTVELRNLQQLRAAGADDATVLLPAPYSQLCARRVLTVDYVEGVPFTTLLQRAADGPDAITALGFDPPTLARNLLMTTLVQIFRLGVFHADLHPGNIIALADGRIGLVDFGIVEHLDWQFGRHLQRYLSAVADDDVPAMYRALCEIVIETDRADWSALRQAFHEQHRIWRKARDQSDEAGHGAVDASFMIGVLRAVRECRFRLSSDTLALYRSLLTAERIAYLIEPRVSLATVGKEFFADLEHDWIGALFAPDRLRLEASRWIEILQQAPGNLNAALADIADGRFVMRIEQSEAASARDRANLRALLIAVAILILSASVLLAGVVVSQAWWRLGAGLTLGCVLVGLFCWMGLLWRRLK